MKKNAVLTMTLIVFLIGMLSVTFNVTLVKADPEGLLLIETDRNVYSLGEPVIITLTNIGDVLVEIGGKPCVMIETYPELEPVWPKFFAPLHWWLAPGESEAWTWNQYNEYTESPAEPGMYVVKFQGVLYTPSEVIEASFEISAPAVPEFPIGLALETLFIPVIIYTLWRSKQRKKVLRGTHTFVTINIVISF